MQLYRNILNILYKNVIMLMNKLLFDLLKIKDIINLF